MKPYTIQVDGFDCEIGIASDDFVNNRATVVVRKGRRPIGKTKVSLNDDAEAFHREVISKVRNEVLKNCDDTVFIMPLPLNLDVTPEMVEQGLELMDSSKVKGCMEEWIKKEWYEYAAVAKKILDQRKQP